MSVVYEELSGRARENVEARELRQKIELAHTEALEENAARLAASLEEKAP